MPNPLEIFLDNKTFVQFLKRIDHKDQRGEIISGYALKKDSKESILEYVCDL